MATAEDDRIDRARRRGARVAIAIFFLIVAGFTLTWTVEIIRQVWFPKVIAVDVGCREGVLGLIAAVERARHAADAETGGERAAVAAFRNALLPEWSERAGLGRVCAGDKLGERALVDVDRLRYAEEHATRYEAADLARRRRGIRTLEQELGGH